MTPDKILLDPQDNSTYCPELWSRAYISQQNDQLAFKPCCYFRPADNPVIKDFSKVFQTINIHHESLRNDNLVGIKNNGCAYCYNFESSGNQSARQLAIQKTGESVKLISHLDLNLGNLCNLSCAICGPFNSSSWVPIAEQGWGKVDNIFKYKADNRHIIDDPELFSQLETIQLQGGEVFLEDNYIKFFENLAKYRTYDNLSIMIFTNGTVRPKEEFVDILNKCKDVRIFFSIDDIEQRFEYQRRGAKWSKVVTNINWFKENLQASLGFNITYSMFNIFYLDETYQKLEQLFPDLHRNYSAFNSGLADCSAQNLAAKEYELIVNKIKDINELNFLQEYLQIKEKPYQNFIDYVLKYDTITGMSYPNSHPEFWDLINS